MTSMSSTKAQLLALVNEQAAQIADLQRQLKEIAWRVEGEDARWTELAARYNAIYGMLDELFALKVYSVSDSKWRDELEWTVEDKETGQVLVERCKPLAAAYYEAIAKKLEEKQ